MANTEILLPDSLIEYAEQQIVEDFKIEIKALRLLRIVYGKLKEIRFKVSK